MRYPLSTFSHSLTSKNGTFTSTSIHGRGLARLNPGLYSGMGVSLDLLLLLPLLYYRNNQKFLFRNIISFNIPTEPADLCFFIFLVISKAHACKVHTLYCYQRYYSLDIMIVIILYKLRNLFLTGTTDTTYYPHLNGDFIL